MRSQVLFVISSYIAHAVSMSLTPTKGSWLVQQLPPGKGSFLLFQWQNAAQTARANGFSPASEAVGEGAFRMKALSDALPQVVAQSKILAMCDQGNLSFDKLQEPHASIAERLSKTKMIAALSAGSGSAVAFVSEWDDHVSIDKCVVNPSYMGLSADAEAHLLRHVATEALEAGKTDVRLAGMFQVDGDEFYERCGFYPTGEEEGAYQYKAE